MTLDSILEEIKKADKIVILTHENPDGDAVASSLSMKIALKQLGKEADVIMDECPKTYRFLPEAKNIKKEIEGMPFILFNGLKWSDLPDTFGSWKTIYNKFNLWKKSGLWSKIKNVLIKD